MLTPPKSSNQTDLLKKNLTRQNDSLKLPAYVAGNNYGIMIKNHYIKISGKDKSGSVRSQSSETVAEIVSYKKSQAASGKLQRVWDKNAIGEHPFNDNENKIKADPVSIKAIRNPEHSRLLTIPRLIAVNMYFAVQMHEGTDVLPLATNTQTAKIIVKKTTRIPFWADAIFCAPVLF